MHVFSGTQALGRLKSVQQLMRLLRVEVMRRCEYGLKESESKFLNGPFENNDGRSSER